MDPALAGVLIAAAILAAMGTLFGAFAYGRGTRQPDVDYANARTEEAEARADAAEAAALARARGEAVDMERDRALATAGDDLERMLHAAGRPDPATPPGEHGPEADGYGAAANDAG